MSENIIAEAIFKGLKENYPENKLCFDCGNLLFVNFI